MHSNKSIKNIKTEKKNARDDFYKEGKVRQDNISFAENERLMGR